MPLADAPQSNKQHAVPQNIMDVEFKLIGDLTMRQFSYLLLFGILSYVSFAVVVGIFKWPLVVIFVLLGVSLAFVPLGERGLDDWIVSFIRAINMPTQRFWKKEPEIPIAFSYQSINVMKQELITLAPTLSRRRLEQYLKNQVEGEGIDPLDIPEREYIMKVREAFAHVQPKEAPSYSGVSSPVGVSVIEEPLPVPEVSVSVSPKKENLPGGYEQPVLEPQKSLSVQEQENKLIKAQRVVPGTAAEQKPVNVQVPQVQNIVKSKITVTAPVSQMLPNKGPVHLLQEENLITKRDYQLGIPSITPDMHSGRKFMNLLPSSGELVLPIRGERIIKTSDQTVVVEDLKEKTEKLQQLLAHIREKEGIRQLIKISEPAVNRPVVPTSPFPPPLPPPLPPAPPTPEPVVKIVQPEKIQEEKIPEQKQEIPVVEKPFMEDRQKQFGEQQKRMEEHTEKMASGYSELGKKYEQLKTELEERKKSDIVSGATALPSSKAEPKYLLTRAPDILSGVVKGADDKLMSDVLVIVKNRKGEAVRAVKTNSMGQFLLLTPLDKGIYTVEISSSNNLTETFDIIPVEVKGEAIPLIEFRGR